MKTRLLIIFAIGVTILLPSVFAEETSWSSISIIGEYRNWELPKDSDIFNLQYRIINGTITNVEAVPTLTIFNIVSNDDGLVQFKIPKNYPFTNYPSEGRERDALYVKIDETRIDTRLIDIEYGDCFYNYSIPFVQGNSKIEFGYSKTLGFNPYVVEDVPHHCITDTIVYTEEIKSFDLNGFTVTTNSSNVVDIKLNWGNGVLPFGTILLDKIIRDTIYIQIPKEMPMTTNLDFGVSFYAIQSPRHAELPIEQTESDCFYNLSIPVRNSDKIKITSVTPAAGKTATIVVHDCEEIEIIRLSLKTQIENNLHVKQIECKNELQILTERSNGKLACVYPATAEKLGWSSV